jgi:PAS domain-containing protein/HPt (histidine-containing phosphotransfer) domain-containing protein
MSGPAVCRPAAFLEQITADSVGPRRADDVRMTSTNTAAIDAAELALLRANEQQFRAMAEHAPVPIVLTRMSDSNITFMNQAAADLVNGGQMYTGPALDFYADPKDRPALIARLRAEGRVAHYPLQLRRSSGVVGDFLMSMQPVLINGAANLCTFVLDVTEQKAAEKALHGRNEEMGLILNNVREGLLIVTTDGCIQPGYSAVVDDWFNHPVPGTSLWDAARSIDAAFADWMQVCWDSVTDNVLPLRLALDQLPRLLRMGDRHIQVVVNAIGEHDDDHLPARFLIILTDITESVARANAEMLQKDALALLDRLLRDRQGVVDFLHEVGDLVKSVAAWSDDDLRGDVRVLKRTIHTIKGNCAMVGVAGVAAICHAVEDAIADDAERPQARQLRPIVDAWEPLSERLRTFLEAQPQEQLDVTPDDLVRVRELMRTDVAAAASMLDSWQRPPLRRRLQRLAAQAQSLARRLGKEVRVVVDDHHLRLEPTAFSGFWASFAHLMRNAIDHGIEAGDVRAANGKSAIGTIRITTMLVPTDTGHGVLEVELVDDGAGINWAAIAHKARALGLPYATHDDLEQALFAEGLSTAEAVTDTSGRGVGTSALRAAVLEAGGSIEVTSPLPAGSGTRFVCSLPLEHRRHLNVDKHANF